MTIRKHLSDNDFIERDARAFISFDGRTRVEFGWDDNVVVVSALDKAGRVSWIAEFTDVVDSVVISVIEAAEAGE